MNIYKNKNGDVKIRCHQCQQEINLDPTATYGEIYYDGDNVRCMFCHALLGYNKDLEKFRNGQHRQF